MLKLDELHEDENLVRGLTPPKWDPLLKRVSPSAFADKNISVSRTAILSYEKIVAIFMTDLHKPPDCPLGATITVTPRLVRHACQSNKDVQIAITVVADPIVNDPDGASDNISHALIRGRDANGIDKKLTRGMANAIIGAAGDPSIVDI